MIHRQTTAPELRQWSDFLKKVRHFFERRDFVEVSTDHLVACGAFESQIDPLAVTVPTLPGRWELHTSPEFEMKKVLSATGLPIYQICKSFRDDPPTEHHRREFTMLEFYRPSVDYKTTQEDLCQLLAWVSGRPLKIKRVTMCDLVGEHTEINLREALEKSDLRREIESRNLVLLSDDDEWDDMFFKLMIEKIEPILDPDIPVLVYDYPPNLCALAEKNPSTGWAERFEVYWKGMEICNGCTELSDADELDNRFKKESELRRIKGKAPHPIPQTLVDAVKAGRRPSSGVAVGLDRLFACVRPLTICKS